LLSDIEAGRIDCVVVYKVDRLSRSLLDFARLMGVFEKRGVDLVSVTQQFNTTASLGRLTLNILLSFAQFEREIIAERTRDKMSAARRKGKWVGGTPVLGYDVAPGGGKLIINEDEARQVRAIFALYLEHKALPPVLREVQPRQWTTKRWTTKEGRLHPGRPLEHQDLIGLLGNVIYAGKVRYQGETYAGEHSAIVEEGVWEKVHGLLQKSARSERGKARAPLGPSLLNPRQRGVVKDYAELARFGQVSRARVTQIMNLLSLAPDIQQQILSWARDDPGGQRVRETTVRALSAEVIWSRQREQWKRWSAPPGHEQYDV
jgi:site-specific DNA recombinase